MHAYRTHTCGALRATDAGETVRVSGWVHRKRDHGDLVFIDLRDHYGMVQIVTEVDGPVFSVIEGLKPESVVTITGKVENRAKEAINPNLPTGEIEVRAAEAMVLSAAQELPLPVAGEQDYPEEVRLRYRFLDLRRETLHANIVTRTKIISDMRRRMEGAGFTEYSTPILTASSPEGARDFLVPSRIHAGKFYALPQAPQQYKQLLMVAGFDRYFQIAPCFRDEDPRADRLPGEFYQLDLEMSFVTQEDVWTTMEPVIAGVFEAFAEGKPVTPAGSFPRIPYSEAILKYGSDKPDLRNPVLITDVTDHFVGSGFGIFASIVESGGVIRAIPAPGAGAGSRKFFDEMNNWARSEGYSGLGYINIKDGEPGGPIAKNHGPEATAKLIEALGLGSDADDAAVDAALSAKLTATAPQAQQIDLLEHPTVLALQAQNTELAGEVKALKDGQAQAAATVFVDAAIAAGHVGVKPLRDEYIAMHMADPAKAAKMIGALPRLTGETLAGGLPPEDGSVALNADDRAVMALFGVDEETYTAELKKSGRKQETL